ncbi:hypothetical protein T492DRAFT_236119 [Pavlovales sp. CCMP2436]|nr:hypothetical protein T492DRAFT_236119 [Pavlovales sp. CCMP2436]
MGLLSLCKTHHWQFDELRFARYSSRMLLHVLHNDLCFAADMQRAVSGTGIDSEGKGKASGLLECKLEPAFAREESSRLALSPLSPRSAAGSKCAALALASREEERGEAAAPLKIEAAPAAAPDVKAEAEVEADAGVGREPEGPPLLAMLPVTNGSGRGCRAATARAAVAEGGAAEAAEISPPPPDESRKRRARHDQRAAAATGHAWSAPVHSRCFFNVLSSASHVTVHHF